MATLQLFNTLTRRKEVFRPLKRGRVSLYSCGPTVYNFAHIGNLRTYIFSDILKRTLLAFGYKVRHIMNITDVGHLTSDADEGEDKLEKGARREKKTVWDVAKFYTEAFKKDIARLNILPPDRWTKATEHIKEQIALISALERKGFIYQSEAAVYFDTARCTDYGKLRGPAYRRDETQKARRSGAAVTEDLHKRNREDFVLWFRRVGKYQDHAMHWPSPWGEGFPGWHIECSAMSMRYLGKTFDIHTGGIDHIGTHHTNEIAQSESATGKPFVRFWLHGAFLTIGAAEKMAKSGENFITLETVIDKRIDPLAYRYFTFSAHYRSPLTFSWEALAAAGHGLKNLRRAVENLFSAKPAKPTADEVMVLEARKQDFLEKVSNDLDMPGALASLWRELRSKDALAVKWNFLIFADKVLGLGLSETRMVPIPWEVEELVRERELSRVRKQFIKADRLRARVEELGYMVEDTSSGPVVRKKQQELRIKN